LSVSRSWYYYKATTSNKHVEDIMLKYKIKKEYLLHPFYGYRKIFRALNDKELPVSEKQIRRLMNEMGLKAIYPKPNLSKPGKGHKIYPYLLRGMEVKYKNQVWATDITYLKINGAFVYLVAVLDLFSRKVLSWQLSNTIDASFCVEALQRAIDIYGVPEIFNTDQGSQFTSDDFILKLNEYDIAISMDGKGRALDNVYIERLWRSLKYENIFLNEYKNLKKLEEDVNLYFEFYNRDVQKSCHLKL
jgi:putative transposase